jgi:hypothetical protein
MSRTLAIGSRSSIGRKATFESVAAALRAIAADHALALGAAAEAELPRKRQSHLRRLYTSNRSAR